MCNKILRGSKVELTQTVSTGMGAIAMNGLDAYNPPNENIPASCILCASELCNRHKKGTGRPRMTTSVTEFSTPMAMSSASRFTHRCLMDGSQTARTGAH